MEQVQDRKKDNRTFRPELAGTVWGLREIEWEYYFFLVHAGRIGAANKWLDKRLRDESKKK